MIKIFLLPLFLLRFIIPGEPEQITDFKELLDILKSGRSVRVIADYSKCKLVTEGKEEKGPEVTGGMSINAFEYFARGSVRNERAFISVSETPLIFHPRYGHILNYVKIRFFEDNEIEITVRYLDPKTFDVKMEETFFSIINDSKNEGGVTLFTE